MSVARQARRSQEVVPRQPALPQPGLTAALARLVVPVNHLFDRLYQSRYNPFYRSGTLAVGLLALVFITGLYLLVLYDVSAPYASVHRIQNQAWLGRWIRALHRYATDASLVAVVYHILQSQVQGKTWGPRLLSWVSGVVLLAFLCVSAWTGYVMVWDAQGQLLATAGAHMMQVVPFLRDALGQAFNGSTPVGASFFFMNLFLHIALPLIMVFGLWVHTSRLARSVWFPDRPILWGAALALLAVSVLWPAPLPPRADLLALPGVVETDWFFAFWWPLLERLSPLYALVFLAALLLVGLSLPWWWRPSADRLPPPSTSDEGRCTGCRQCSLDCPYEAIAMVPRPEGGLPHSRVDPALCVSCGICAASCDLLAIGPPASRGSVQLDVALAFCAALPPAPGQATVVAVVCDHNPGARRRLEAHAAGRPGVHVLATGCIGTLHTRVLETLLARSAGVFVWGCPARNCLTREGVTLLDQRAFHKRPPSVSRRIDKQRLHLESASAAEGAGVLARLDAFQQRLRNPDLASGADGGTGGTRRQAMRWFAAVATGGTAGRTMRWLVAAAATTGLMLGLAGLSRVPMGQEPTTGVLRIAGRIPGLAIQDCRRLSADELARLPVHMRRPEVCTRVAPTYILTVAVDGAMAARREVRHSGLHDDRPLFLDEEVPVTSGAHRVNVDLRPRDPALTRAPKLSLATPVQVAAGRVHLIGYDPEGKALRLLH